MINEDTLFILGAGASIPYGLPSARELRKKIIDNTRALTKLKYVGVSDSEPLKTRALSFSHDFEKRFRDSNNESIDYFLTRNPILMEFGKEIISYCIHNDEMGSGFAESLSENNQKSDWYFYLYNYMIQKLKKPDSYNLFKKNRVSFITFNYDRSLEYFLYTSLLNSFGEITPAICDELLDYLDIVHVYGSLGTNDIVNNYKRFYEHDEIKSRSKYIEIIRDGNVAEKINIKFQTATRIFIIGFGFDDTNLMNLRFYDQLTRFHKIYATSIGLNERKVDIIRGEIMKQFNIQAVSEHPIIPPVFENINSLELLKKYL
jgi:hypothetical protein